MVDFGSEYVKKDVVRQVNINLQERYDCPY
jgi:hypothetical protein